MILTQGEKIVWAAAFVDEKKRLFSTTVNRFDALTMDEVDAAYDKAVRSGVEVACGVVKRLRGEVDAVEKDCGKDSDVAQMLRAMLGDDG